jgi:protein-S-isoprenylcysteine O-methyltransferase Ste14
VSEHEKPTSGNPIRLLLHVPVPWVFILAYLVGIVLEVARPLPLSAQAQRAAGIAGGLVFLLGATIAGWGLVLFRKARTTTVPGRTSAALVTWGPYRFTRNPMYVGLTLAYLGEAGLLRQIWPVVLLPLVVAYVNGIVIPLEEARLQASFPQEYDGYRARVRRWI